MAELELIWAIVVSIIVVILAIIVVILTIRERRIKRNYEDENRNLKESIPRERADAVKQSRSTLKGKIGEQMSPLFPEFYSKYEPADARFIGSPIDYIIFKNMGKFSKDKKELIEIIFLDIKTGSPTLSSLQNAIKSAVKFGRIDFQVLPLRIEQQRNLENKPCI